MEHTPLKRVLALSPKEINVVLELQLENEILLNSISGCRQLNRVAE